MSAIRKNSSTALWLVALFLFAASVIASDQSNEPGALKFQADVAIGSRGTSEAAIKNKLMLEKLTKMGRAKSQGCTRCHGRVGMQSLAKKNNWTGSVTEFVVTRLTEFRDGKRHHEVMSSIAQNLSDQDIALIATWYQSVSPGTD